MKRIDFLCSVAIGLIVYFVIAVPSYLDLQEHQPGRVPLNQATGFPPEAAWIYPIPFAILSIALGMVLLFSFRKFFRSTK